MKIIYFASYILSAPFFAVSWLCFGIAFALDWIGATIHDQTTYRAWMVLHKRNQ